jgi:hypothetical protein
MGFRGYGKSENHVQSLIINDLKLLEEFQTSFRMENQRRLVSLSRKQNFVLASNWVNAKNDFTT